ncbi:MAG: ribose 5-phosphate isomerase B [Planctomycetota bacterium]
MRIAVASDHAGYACKLELKAFLEEQGHSVEDHGCHNEESMDYPDTAAPAARAVVLGKADRAILLCGTGIGESITANKVHGVRAALLHDDFSAEMCRRHNDANVACFGARILTAERIRRLATIFLDTPFEGGRHGRRVDKMMALEKDECSS